MEISLLEKQTLSEIEELVAQHPVTIVGYCPDADQLMSELVLGLVKEEVNKHPEIVNIKTLKGRK